MIRPARGEAWRLEVPVPGEIGQRLRLASSLGVGMAQETLYGSFQAEHDA